MLCVRSRTQFVTELLYQRLAERLVIVKVKGGLTDSFDKSNITAPIWHLQGIRTDNMPAKCPGTEGNTAKCSNKRSSLHLCKITKCSLDWILIASVLHWFREGFIEHTAFFFRNATLTLTHQYNTSLIRSWLPGKVQWRSLWLQDFIIVLPVTYLCHCLGQVSLQKR